MASRGVRQASIVDLLGGRKRAPTSGPAVEAKKLIRQDAAPLAVLHSPGPVVKVASPIHPGRTTLMRSSTLGAVVSTGRRAQTSERAPGAAPLPAAAVRQDAAACAGPSGYLPMQSAGETDDDAASPPPSSTLPPRSPTPPPPSFEPCPAESLPSLSCACGTTVAVAAPSVCKVVPARAPDAMVARDGSAERSTVVVVATTTTTAAAAAAAVLPSPAAAAAQAVSAALAATALMRASVPVVPSLPEARSASGAEDAGAAPAALCAVPRPPPFTPAPLLVLPRALLPRVFRELLDQWSDVFTAVLFLHGRRMRCTLDSVCSKGEGSRLRRLEPVHIQTMQAVLPDVVMIGIQGRDHVVDIVLPPECAATVVASGEGGVGSGTVTGPVPVPGAAGGRTSIGALAVSRNSQAVAAVYECLPRLFHEALVGRILAAHEVFCKARKLVPPGFDFSKISALASDFDLEHDVPRIDPVPLPPFTSAPSLATFDRSSVEYSSEILSALDRAQKQLLAQQRAARNAATGADCKCAESALVGIDRAVIEHVDVAEAHRSAERMLGLDLESAKEQAMYGQLIAFLEQLRSIFSPPKRVMAEAEIISALQSNSVNRGLTEEDVRGHLSLLTEICPGLFSWFRTSRGEQHFRVQKPTFLAEARAAVTKVALAARARSDERVQAALREGARSLGPK